MGEFFRFPHTPHLTWLGTDTPRDDKVLDPVEAEALLKGSVLVEEKLDGANLGLSLADDGQLRAQNRGQYLQDPHSGQFSRLHSWLAQHGEAIRAVLRPELMLFGEWCAARHSLDYVALPDWLLVFDVYDRNKGKFWSSRRRDALAEEAGLKLAHQVFSGHTSVKKLVKQVQTTPSHYRDGPLEGLVIRRESFDWCEARAKLVRADFTQAIEQHWRKRVIEWNRVQHLIAK